MAVVKEDLFGQYTHEQLNDDPVKRGQLAAVVTAPPVSDLKPTPRDWEGNHRLIKDDPKQSVPKLRSVKLK